MRVVSVNVGTPEEIRWHDTIVRTAFRKRPVARRIAVQGVNLEGDDQADRTVHGGPRKSVYVYPSEHYAYWEEILEVPRLSFGAFGENLTTEGWLETETRPGDRVRIGTADLIVTQLRRPCYKANAVYGRDDMIDLFHRSRRSGFYLGILRAGEIGPGDAIELQAHGADAPTIAQLAEPASEPSKGDG